MTRVRAVTRVKAVVSVRAVAGVKAVVSVRALAKIKAFAWRKVVRIEELPGNLMAADCVSFERLVQLERLVCFARFVCFASGAKVRRVDVWLEQLMGMVQMVLAVMVIVL